MGQLTSTRISVGTPDPDGDLKEVVSIKIRHYRNVYLNHLDPIVFIPLAVDNTGHLYDDFIRLICLHDHREVSDLVNELSEESDQFRFLRAERFSNLKGTVGLIMVKVLTIRISIPLDLSSRSFMSVPRFIRSCRPKPFFRSFTRTFSSVFSRTKNKGRS